MTRPRLPEFGEIVAALQARPLEVAERYAPGGTLSRGDWWALDPGRADRRPGSFVVHVSGHRAGRWRDFASDEGGDMLDLIQRALGCDRKGALEEARGFLGIDAEETPEQKRLRRQAAERAERLKAEAERKARADAERARRAAHALWLDCRPIGGTPAAAYLEGRGVGPRALGREPGAIRFHPALRYEHVDPETGEVVEGEWPCMVTAVHGPWREGEPPGWAGVHRTWIARGEDGRWRKAPVPKAKKMLGPVRGGFMRLWSGFGPKGGKGRPLAQAEAAARVYVAEGIEDALSAAVLLGATPGRYVVAAGSLSLMGCIGLPPQLRDVTLIADRDPGVKAREALQRAEARLAAEGRTVRRWMNHHGGKDLNDALMRALAFEGRAA